MVLKNTLPNTISVVAGIIARLLIFNDRLTDISRDWKRNMVNEKLLDIFNLTLPCGDECPLSLAKSVDCLIDPARELISLTFDVKNIKKTAHLLKADPFVLYHRKNNGSVVCSVTYIGPKKVVYESMTDLHCTLTSSLSCTGKYGDCARFYKV